MFICVDFDGTIVTHEYPNIGQNVPFAIEKMKSFIASGHNIILLTMRSGETLTEAVEYLEERGVKLYGVNDNPSQIEWTSSRKVYGHIYIDDAAYGCPLIQTDFNRPYVDWEKINI